MSARYWLVLPNGGRQLIDPAQFDLDRLAEHARRVGGRLVAEPTADDLVACRRPEPPVAALGPLFRARLDRVHACRVDYAIDMNNRPTVRVLGGYYRRRRLVRVYVHDRRDGRRPTEELFETFLHEVAHHLEYTEAQTFGAEACDRVPGRMHSRLFWLILGELKGRWADLRRPGRAD